MAPAPERITLDRHAARALFRYAWPLNIRELEQALRTAVALTDTGETQREHLFEAIRTYAPPAAGERSQRACALYKGMAERVANRFDMHPSVFF